MLIRVLLAAFCAMLFTGNAEAAMISEVFPNTENDAMLEYIALKNNSCMPEDISGYSLSDASGKVFSFSSGTILSSFSELRFFRPETKITLNNDNESLYLRSISWEILDSFSYSTSVKNEAIIRTMSADICAAEPETSPAPEISSGASTSEDTHAIGDSDAYSQSSTGNIVPEITGSGSEIDGELLSSSWSFGEIVSSSGVTTSGSGTVLTSSGSQAFLASSGTTASWSEISLMSSGVLISGETSSGSTAQASGSTTQVSSVEASGAVARIHVQSGLDSDLRCYKEDCSVNFEYPSPKTTDSCSWNFGGGEAGPLDASKCNPSYVHYSYGTYQVRLRLCTAAGTCSEDTIVVRVIEPEASSSSPGVSSASASTPSSVTSTTVLPTATVPSSGIAALPMTQPISNTPPRIVFSPDSKGEADSRGDIIALCSKTSKKPCRISVTPLIFQEDSWKQWEMRWVLPNGSKRYSKVLKNIAPTLKRESYIFEIFSRASGKSFRFSVGISKRFVDEEVFETESAEISLAASSEEKISASGTTSKKTSKTTKTAKTATPKTTTKAVAPKTVKAATSSGTTAKTKTSAVESGAGNSGSDGVKILLLFAASILSFGLGLSISRLFLPERGKWISSGGSDENL